MDNRERLIGILRRLQLDGAERHTLEARIRKMSDVKAEILANKADDVFASIDRLIGDLIPLMDEIRDVYSDNKA